MSSTFSISMFSSTASSDGTSCSCLIFFRNTCATESFEIGYAKSFIPMWPKAISESIILSFVAPEPTL